MVKIRKKDVERWKRGICGVKQMDLTEYTQVPKLRRTYKQEWSAYNLAQTNEYSTFQDLLIELLDSLIQIRNPVWKNGRPFANIKDILFCCVMKVYFGKSSRRNSGYLANGLSKGYISKIPHFNTLLNYFRNSSLTPLLIHLIEQSGIPLRELEETFATDSSGFSTRLYGRWFNARCGKDSLKRLYKKAHVSSGVRTGIIAAISVTDGYWHDSPQFGELVKTTAANFHMKEMLADAGYMARDNYDAVSNVGAIPYIMFRSNNTGKARGSMVYKRMFELFKDHREEFLAHYHKRSNAESVFSMIKRKFGLKLYSKSEFGQVNELLCLILAHNICVLIHELFESNAIIDFEDCQPFIVRQGYCAKV